MDKDTVGKIIANLIKKTKDKSIKWDRLIKYNSKYNQNPILSDYFNMFNQVDYINSYYVYYNRGYIFLVFFDTSFDIEFDSSKGNCELVFQSSEYAKIQKIDADENEKLRLQNIIEGYVDDNESFIDSLLED